MGFHGFHLVSRLLLMLGKYLLAEVFCSDG
jgi:hypothetical protein